MRASISSLVEEGPNVATIFVFLNVNVFTFYWLICPNMALNTDVPIKNKMGLVSPI